MEDEKIDHPSHYVEGRKFETIEVIEDWELGYHLGNAVKYISRSGRKENEIEDIKKAIWYLKRYKNSIEPGVHKNQKNKCVHCGKYNVVKFGKRKNKFWTKQLYRCNSCKRKFAEGQDLVLKADKATTDIILDLHAKGMSLRKIKGYLKQFHKIGLDHSNILRRIQKYK